METLVVPMDTANTYDLILKQSKNVNARLYSVYENDRLLLKSVHLEDINQLKINKESKLKVVVEPEITGVKLAFLLFLQLVSGLGDRHFFDSFFYDSIEIKDHPFSQLNLTYDYSFHESFSLDEDFVNVQQKIISFKIFYILLLFLIPVILILLYCISVALLGVGYFIVRIVIALVLCALLIYLSYQLYRLYKFKQ
ncbi:hypothetical protein KG089_00660 [Carnobacteriaceae bacterium zg-ZUI252]|nr:hypothetical protein [Carnobacteriaceae bacterium zg-ZUI252]MBS4770804.1 hypothetical protein [Carnobacteriaceae bacterium zg-ZUI240]